MSEAPRGAPDDGALDVALVQLRPRKGPPEANVEALAAVLAPLTRRPPAVIVLPEAALTGYFLEGATRECARDRAAFAGLLAEAWRRAGGRSEAAVEIVAGFFERDGDAVYNAALAARLEGGAARVLYVHRKLFLPTYGVFDEARFVARGSRAGVYAGVAGATGLAICEDLWHGVVPTVLALKGARLLCVPSASPARGVEAAEAGAASEPGSLRYWRRLLQGVAAEHGVFVCYAGLVGFEGGKAMSGGSCVVDPFGAVLGALPSFEPGVLRVGLDLEETGLARAALPLTTALRDVAPGLLDDPELREALAGVLPTGAAPAGAA